MKRIVTIVIVLLLAACSLPDSTVVTHQPVTASPVFCGDGRCTGPENSANCPQDCPAPIATSLATPPAGTTLQPAAEANSFWVTNPASGARLFVRTFTPQDWNGSDPLPALLLMPGGIAESDPNKAARLANQGFLVVIFDADGRGQSEGTEDYNGSITQDGLAAVARAVLQLPDLDPERFGLVSYSYGVTAASGALARHPDLPIHFYIDWEGPVDRMYTTTGCTIAANADIHWQPCNDEAWWAEREAITFITDVNVPYQRIQSEQDHVQKTNDHAIDIVNAAVAGDVPWVRLNEYPAGQTYDKANPPAMLADELDRRLEQIVALYATYIIEYVLPSLP